MVIPLCEYTKNPLNFMGYELNHNMNNKMVTEKKKGTVSHASWSVLLLWKEKRDGQCGEG